jgi:hypothetical protein
LTRTAECKDHLASEEVDLRRFIPDLPENQKRTGNYFNRRVPVLGVPFGAFAGLVGSICVLVFAGGNLFEDDHHYNKGVKVVGAYGAVSTPPRRTNFHANYVADQRLIVTVDIGNFPPCLLAWIEDLSERFLELVAEDRQEGSSSSAGDADPRPEQPLQLQRGKGNRVGWPVKCTQQSF